MIDSLWVVILVVVVVVVVVLVVVLVVVVLVAVVVVVVVVVAAVDHARQHLCRGARMSDMLVPTTTNTSEYEY